MGESLQHIDRTRVRWRGRTLIFFSGCDYFRLSAHPKILRAVEVGLRKFGLTVSASRVTTGNHPLYLELEKELARFFGAEAALLAGGGYTSSQVVTQALANEFTHAFIDEFTHGASRDSVRMLECPVVKFKHRDAADLARKLRRLGKNARPIVLTDGMFGHSGAAAPLAAYLKALPARGLLLVDDAHGGGTFGRTGKGTIEVTGVSRKRIVQCVTLSKAFGVYGGAILCSKVMRQKIAAQSRLYAGSTPLPLPLAYAAYVAVRLLQTDKSLRRRFDANIRFVRSALRDTDITLPETVGPILSFQPKDARQARRLTNALLAAGIFPPYIRYAAGPLRSYFRFVISSEHSRKQLEKLVQVLRRRLT